MNESQQKCDNSSKIDRTTQSNRRDMNEPQPKFDNSSKIDQTTQSNSRDKTLVYRRKTFFV